MQQEPSSSYVIVIKESIYAEQKGQEIANFLLKKHSEKKTIILKFKESILELQQQLSQTWTESTGIIYTCFLSTIEQLSKTPFFKEMYKILWQSSGFMQTLWGIVITDADHDIQRLLSINELPIKQILSGTQFNLNAVNSGIIYSELEQCQAYQKNPQEKAKQVDCPKDASHEMIDHLNTGAIDCIITSGHARETEWNIGFSFKSGKFVPKNGKIAGKNIKGELKQIVADNPKIVNAVGNCLMGNVNKKECMAVNWMGSGAVQLLGYTVYLQLVVTWFGFAGWGVNKYFIEMAGQYNFSQAFFANLQMLYLELQTKFPLYKDLTYQEATNLGCKLFQLIEIFQVKHNEYLSGLLHDKTVVAFYGDPAIDARIVKEKNYVLPYTTEIKQLQNDTWKITIQTNCDGNWESPVADDHDTIPGRPPFYFVNQSFNKPQVIEGKIIFGKFFLILPLKGKFKKNAIYTASFKDSLKDFSLS